MTRRVNRVSKDTRVTIKIDRALAEAIAEQIRNHPEWGMSSVPEFIRRAVDRELDYRNNTIGKKVLELRLVPSGSPEDNQRRDL